MAKYPVVVYGASGYTGMLTMDWLIDQNIPFTAVARNAGRVHEMMAQRVVRLESATYEVIEANHTVEALTEAFRGAKVVCNTVGPFAKFGLTTVEAALKAGCHHLDTTGEQSYVRNVRDQFGELYAQAGLLVSPSLAYMNTFSEIAAELALEHPGIDSLETSALCRGQRGIGAGVTVGSTASIFEMYRAEHCPVFATSLGDSLQSDRSMEKRLLAQLKKSRFTSEHIVDDVIRALEKGRLYVMTQPDAKWAWRLKRWMPETYFRLIAYLYRNRKWLYAEQG